MHLEKPTVIVFCGPPASGKTTIATLVAKILNLRIIDSDATRDFVWGTDHPGVWDEQAKQHNKREFMFVYDVIHRVVAGHASLGVSVIVTAPYTSGSSWGYLQEAIKAGSIDLKIIWCLTSDASQEAVESRIAERSATYRGYSDSYEKVKASMDAFAPVTLPHVKLDTSTTTVEECVQRAIEYICSV